jgi:antitoxin ParD1/3/4
MNIIFPPVDESYIKAKVDDGFYSNATELVRDAVRRLREHDDGKYVRLMAALEAGEQAAREGRTKPYTPELLDRIEQNARRSAAESRIPNPDVCP